MSSSVLPAKRLADATPAATSKIVRLNSAPPNTVSMGVQRAENKVVKLGNLLGGTNTHAQMVEHKVVKLGNSLGGTRGLAGVPAVPVDNSPEALLDRSERFVEAPRTVSLKDTGRALGPGPKTQLGLAGAKAGNIKGTSTDLEKPYLRLHFAPDPSTIRPPHVLERALALVKKKWTERADYAHAVEQLNSIHMDCKMQGVENELTCHAYETHLRLALEKADLAEFTRCLTSLNELYHKAHLLQQNWSSQRLEMTAYRMLFLMREEAEMLGKTSSLLKTLLPHERRDQHIVFCSKVCTALLIKDYCTFFRLYSQAPYMSGYVIDFFVDRVRVEALETYIKAYLGTEVALDDLKGMLCFDKRKQCFRWLQDQGCVMTDDKRHLDTKKSYEARTSAGVRGGGGVGGKNAGAKRLIQEQQENGIKRAPLSIDELLAAGKQKEMVKDTQKQHKKMHKAMKKQQQKKR